MMKILSAGTLLAGFLAIATPSSGQSDYQGTPAQRSSCRPDVYRLCAGEIPNVRAITACLRKNYSRLSAGCAAVFADSAR
jgi:hypothetical protein